MSSDNASDSEEIKKVSSKPLDMTDAKAKKQKMKELNQKMRETKKARGEEVSETEEDDDDDDGSLFDEDDSEEDKKAEPPKKAAPQAEASENYSDDEMELSQSGKQPTPKPNKA